MRKRNVVIGAGAAVAIAGMSASIAVASIPDGRDGMIHACRSLKSGAVRVVDVEAGQQCSRTEQAIKWNGDTRRSYLVSRSPYNSAVELSTTPTTLLSVVVPTTIQEGTYLLTARIPTNGDAGVTITCTANGAAGNHNYDQTFRETESYTVGSGDDGILEFHTIAVPSRDYDTDEWVPITVQCAATGGTPDAHSAFVQNYHIALIPIPAPIRTE